MGLPVPEFVSSRRFKKWLLGIVGVLLALAAVLAWQVPKLLRGALTQDVSQLLGRQVQVGDISFNPFTLTVRAREISIAQPGAAPLFEAVGFEASASWLSLFWLAPVVDSLVLDQPKFSLVREDPTRFNFSDIIQRFAGQPEQAEPEAEKSSGLPRFSLNNLRIKDGVITLDDQVTGRRQVIDDVNVGLPFLSTLRYATNIDVVPHLSLRVNGSPIVANGTNLPFNKMRRAVWDLNFEGLDLAVWADAWPLPVPVKLPSALLDSRLQVHFEQPAGEAPRVRVTGGVGLRQVDLREADGRPLLAWDALRINRIDLEPLAHTVKVGEVRLLGPRAEVSRDAAGQLNWMRALAMPAEPEAAPADAPATEASTSAAPSADAPAGKTEPQGDAAQSQPPSPKPAESSPWQVAVDSVKLESGGVHIHDQASGWDYPIDGLALTAEGFSLPESASHPLQVWLDMDNPLDGSWLRVHTPVVLQPLGLSVDAQLGQLALAPFSALARSLAPVELDGGRLRFSAHADVQGDKWSVSNLQAGLAGVAARDMTQTLPMPFTLGKLDVTASRLALDDQAGQFSARATDLLGNTTLDVKGSQALQPLALQADINLDQFALAPFSPLIKRYAPVEVDDGVLDAHTAVTVNGNQWSLANVRAGLANLAARDMTQTLPMPFTLGKLDVTADKVALNDQPSQFTVQATNLLGDTQLGVQGSAVPQPLAVQAQIQLDRFALAPFAPLVSKYAPVKIKDGSLDLKTGFKLENGAQWSLADLQATLTKLALDDGSTKPAVPYSADKLALTADKLALGGSQPTRFTVNANGLQGAAALAVQGTAVQQPLSVQAKVDLTGFDVASVSPYFASSLNATLRKAVVAVRGDASFAAPDGKKPRQVGWKGDLAVTDLDLEDRVNRADFLRWGKLAMDGTAFSMAGEHTSVNLGKVALDNFYGNVLLNPEGRLNVMDLVAAPGEAGGSITQDTQTRGVAPTTAKSGSGGKLDIALEGVRLSRGNMTFQDRFVKPNYTAELSSVEGSVSAVSSSKPAPAKVDVGGRVYRTAPFSVKGTVQPFADFLSLDLKASAKGVDLPKFTTYSSKYVGYPIKRGKLSMDLGYQIKDRALQATNHVVLNQLTFGDPSNSPDALKLPVLLAVSLLKDSQGNIDINLPISGSLDDPEFSVGGIIVRVFVNLITKAVTAPFQLLASAFGGGDTDLSYIGFEPGSSTLDETATASIATLAKALNDRPGLKLDISGRADPAVDEPALRKTWVEQRLREVKAEDQSTRSKKVDPATVEVTADERDDYLEEVYDDTDIETKPRNFLGMSKSVPPDQMQSMLEAAAPIDKAALQKLAEARAEQVYEALRGQGPADRIFIVQPRLDAEGVEEGSVTSRVDFSLQ